MKDLKTHVEKGFCFAGLSFLASPSIVKVTKSGLFKPPETVSNSRSLQESVAPLFSCFA